MTYEEALEKLKFLIGGESDQYPPDYDIPIQMAVAAIEKQIPKEPIKDGYRNLCPNCESEYIEIWIDGGFEETKMWCCPTCGQAIDWSEEK